MTEQQKSRLAATLAGVLGLLSVKEGGMVLLGLTTKAYTVLPWLVWYNVLLGMTSVIAAIGLWQQRAWAVRVAGATIVSLHGVVLLLLVVLYAFGVNVAVASILAMLMRTAVWAGILLLTRETARGENGGGVTGKEE
ncbi:MAG: hypothetical protein OEW15_02745 [Nitrospirota bacterium]|nr:hypothetical protein [Nitrospirota bacterium]